MITKLWSKLLCEHHFRLFDESFHWNTPIKQESIKPHEWVQCQAVGCTHRATYRLRFQAIPDEAGKHNVETILDATPIPF